MGRTCRRATSSDAGACTQRCANTSGAWKDAHGHRAEGWVAKVHSSRAIPTTFRLPLRGARSEQRAHTVRTERKKLFMRLSIMLWAMTTGPHGMAREAMALVLRWVAEMLPIKDFFFAAELC